MPDSQEKVGDFGRFRDMSKALRTNRPDGKVASRLRARAGYGTLFSTRIMRNESSQKLFEFPDEHPASAISDINTGTRRKIHRIRPPVKAHGGKYYLARQIVPILLSAPGNPAEYLEPCAFGASVYLAMPRFKREILGDVNPDVVALWQVLSHEQYSTTLSRRLATIPYSASQFEAAKAESPVSVIDQAMRFLILCRFSRGGLGQTFAWSERQRGGRPGDANAWHTFCERGLPKIIDRARGVTITNDPCWWTVWQSRDKVQRLVYADPPYMKQTRTAPDAYGPFEMTRLHHFWLVAALRAHSGPAAISGYRSYDYDRWLHDWRRFDFEVPNNSGQSEKKQRRTESLWTWRRSTGGGAGDSSMQLRRRLARRSSIAGTSVRFLLRPITLRTSCARNSSVVACRWMTTPNPV